MRFSVSEEKQREIRVILFSLLCVSCVHILFMLFSSKHLLSDNPYNSYARQAAAWLQGRLDLGGNYEWLELAVYEGKYYVSFPSFPSYVLLPFALLFGDQTPDSLLAFLVMLIGVCYAAKIALHAKLNETVCVFFAVFLYLSNNLWQITVDGWVWFFAQNLSFTLTMASFYHALAGKKGRACFFLAAAAGCRPFQLLYFPLICILLFRTQSGKSFREKMKTLFWKRAYVFLAALLLGTSYLLLNAARFGNPLEFGHNYLPEFTDSEYGQFSPQYIWGNLQNLFRMPVFDEATGKLDAFCFNGINLFIVYPLLILCIVLFCRWFIAADTGRREHLVLAASALVLCTVHTFLFLMHKTMGGAHFGNRYIADLIPAVYVLAVLSAAGAGTGKEPGGPEGKCTALPFFAALLFLGGLVFNFTGVLQFYSRA